MKNLNKLLYAAAALSLVACNSNKKIKNSETTKKTTSPFLVKQSSDGNHVISLNYSKEDISCKSPCQLYKTDRFLKLTNSNIDSLYNYKGKLISQVDNQKSKLEITNNFAKVTSGEKVTVFSGYNGEKLFEKSIEGSNIKMSDKFLILQGENLKIWNSFGQLMDEKKVSGDKVNTYISNNFVGYILGYKKLVLYSGNNHKLANYTYNKKRPMRIQLNDSFAYYSIGKDIGVLHGREGQKLMNFAGRPTEAIYMNKNVGGFYDLSESASFWRSNGSHIVSLIKEPGLEISQINNEIEYRTKKNKRFVKIN